MKPAFYTHRKFHKTIEGHANGLRQEVPTIHAPIVERLEGAAAYYRKVTRADMSTGERIDRAIHLSEVFDAEARHEFI